MSEISQTRSKSTIGYNVDNWKPFERIAMDMIRPLPKTSAGKQFVLVISDYAERYLEAYAMTTKTAISVAEKLMDLFSHHRVPREILTDQGTNFKSELLQELHKLLGIKSIRTSLLSTNQWSSQKI